MRTRLAAVLVAPAANQVALPVAAAMSHVRTSPLYPAAAEPCVPSAVIETGQRVVRQRFGRNFQRAYAKALRTAR